MLETMSRLKYRFMKLNRKSPACIIIYLISLVIVVKIGYILINQHNSTITSDAPELPNAVNVNLQSCPIPKYYDLKRYPKNRTELPQLECPTTIEPVSTKDGIVKILNNYTCTYQCINWKTDFDYQLTESLPLKDEQSAPCSYFVVSCKPDKDNDKVLTQIILSPVRIKPLIDQSASTLKGKTKPNDVIVIGIDSMSYQSYQYHLPKTFATFHDQLKGVSFKKFNTMGDGTTVNVQAFLTGTKDTETYEARRRISGSKSVDGFDWIWKRYKEKGYVTMYSEEMTDYGTFQYRLNGFEKQPTDFYLRTPLMMAERSGIYKNFCMGNRTMHSQYFQFFNEFQKVYHDVPKFSFVFFAMMSHDDNKYATYIDNDLSQFIANLRLNNPEALIVLYSDHGHRFTSRLTMAGKYEERLPFLGISLPKSKENLHPVMVKNSEILTSGLDLHATLEDIIGVYSPKSIRDRHMSLFRPLPDDRRCEDIESLPHWCSCLNWKSIENPNTNTRLLEIGHGIVERISNFTQGDRELCAELKLDKILVVYRLDAHKAVLKFKNSADVDGFVPDLSDKLRQTVHWYRMTLTTKPGNAQFDLTVSIDETGLTKGSKVVIDKIRPEEVSRINVYAPWVKCLTKRKSGFVLVSDIRKFCICKDVL